MKPLVDEAPYPWPRREAQELHRALCEVYPTSKGAMFVAQRAGLDPAQLFGDQASFLLWKDVLEMGATALRNRDVVTVARDQNPTSARRTFFDALLAAIAPPTLDAEPTGADGAPRFLVSTDTITEPEALLFHDDLTLQIGHVPGLIATLQTLLGIAPAVCLLHVTRQGVSQTGTGFRISDNRLLTNWHVVNVQGQAATAIAAEFGFDDDGKGGGLASTSVACDLASISGDAGDDWAVITTADPLAPSIPILPLSEAVAPTLNAAAFIVQHPAGQRKRVAFVRNQITAVDARVVQYLSDTQPGSSGSPVLDGQGRLIGLHHAGGRPQEVAGRPPMRKNEGIRIERVRQGLVQRQIAVP